MPLSTELGPRLARFFRHLTDDGKRERNSICPRSAYRAWPQLPLLADHVNLNFRFLN